MTTVGRISGDMKKALTRSRPGNRYRTRATATGAPSTVARTAVTRAIPRLSTKESRNSCFPSASPYQRSVKPCGGNVT